MVTGGDRDLADRDTYDHGGYLPAIKTVHQSVGGYANKCDQAGESEDGDI
jgi:hypothetical protein